MYFFKNKAKLNVYTKGCKYNLYVFWCRKLWQVSESRVDGSLNISKISGNVDLLLLGAIEQAAFVMERFEKGMTALQLVECLKDEKSLFQAYLLFFSQMKWIKEDAGQWRLTEKGRQAGAELNLPEQVSDNALMRQPDSII